MQRTEHNATGYVQQHTTTVEGSRDDRPAPGGTGYGDALSATAQGSAASRGPAQSAAVGAWAGFTIRDVVFLAVNGVLVMVFSALTGPLHAIGIFGLPQMLVAPFFAFFMAIGIMRVRKPGSATIIAAVSAVLTLVMRPASGLLALAASLIVECVVLAIFRGYRRTTAVYTVTIAVPIAMVPVQILYYGMIMGRGLSEIVGMNAVVGTVLVMTVVLSVVGSWVGVRTARELIASGRMR